MLRLRLFRILLPGLLLVLGAVVAINLRPRSTPHKTVPTLPDEPEVEIVRYEEFVGDERTVTGDVARVRDAEDGTLRFEGIENLVLSFPEGPVEIRADHADRQGAEGEWLWAFVDGVEFHDPAAGLRLSLPVLDVDEGAGTAVSEGEIRFAAPGVSGEVRQIVYGLRGQPGQLEGPSIEREDGSRLRAARGTLWDGFHDVELVENVRAEQPGAWLESDRLRVRRDERDRLRSAEATGAVRGGWSPEGFPPVELSAEGLAFARGPAGRFEEAALTGGARVVRGDDVLSAPSIRAEATPAGFTVEAGSPARATGRFASGPGELRAGRLEADLSASGMLVEVRADREVTFESRDVQGLASRAQYRPGDEVRLFGEAIHKARLATGATRIAAISLTTTADGSSLSGTGAVEATLLPETEGRAGGTGVFARGEAVHFVSEELEATGGGAEIRFRGDVRGWQGERNLAADSVDLTRTPDTLAASGDVVSRVPRAGQALLEADFIQVEAQRLDYDRAESRAVYDGSVRMRFAEGRLEAGRLEIDIDPESGRITEARAFEDVTLEIDRKTGGEPTEAISGRADRLIYHPDAQTVQLIGERSPAEVRKAAEGATTAARVLLYRLDRGTYEVESGTIRTPDN